MNNEKCSEVKHESAAQEVLKKLGRLAEMAEKVSERTGEQLHPVCLEAEPSQDKNCEAPERKYPPFFNEMRERMKTIEYALRRVNDTLDRCEI